MLTRLANLGIRFPKRVLGGRRSAPRCWRPLYGSQAASHLASGGFYDTQAESGIALNTLTNTFHTGDPNLILEVSNPAGVDSSATRTAGQHIVDDLQHQRFVSQVLSYWTAPAAQAAGLRSHDGKAGLIAARVVGDDNQAPKRAYAMYKSLVGTHNGITVKAGGIIATVHTVNDLTPADLTKSEMIAIPITVIALIWVFGSFIASLLPLVVGISSIVGTMAMLRGLGLLTDVSIYALNMTTAMGLALAIDYSLFIISRYREEIRRGVDPDEAIRTTMQTAGRTVLFSALTVGLSLSAMLVFPMYFLRSFGYAGIGVVTLATIAALLLLRAMLKILGPRVDALDLRAFVRRRLGRPAPIVKPLEETFWYRFAKTVMRRALPIGLVVTALLVGLGLPFLHANFGFPDDRVIPKTEAAHAVGDDLRTNFSSNAGSTIRIVVPNTSAAAA